MKFSNNIEFRDWLMYILKYKDYLQKGDINAVQFLISQDKNNGYTGYILTEALMRLGFTPQQMLDKMTDRIYESQFDGVWEEEILKVPDTVCYIYDYAFANNDNLKEVHIGKVARIKEYAFKDCKNLTDVYIDLKYADALGAFIFEEVFKGCLAVLHFNDGHGYKVGF